MLLYDSSTALSKISYSFISPTGQQSECLDTDLYIFIGWLSQETTIMLPYQQGICSLWNTSLKIVPQRQNVKNTVTAT